MKKKVMLSMILLLTVVISGIIFIQANALSDNISTESQKNTFSNDNIALQKSLNDNFRLQDDDDNDDQHNETTTEENETVHEERESEFSLNIEQEANKVTVKLENKTKTTNVELEFEIEAEDDLKLELEFEFQYKGVNTTQTKMDMEIKITKFVEYIDKPNENNTLTPGYDVGVDKIIQELSPKDINFVFSNVSIQNTGNAKIYVLEAVGTFKNSTFIFRTYFTDSSTSLNNNITINPTETKFDLEILNFPYEDNNSQIATMIQVESSLKVKEKGIEDDDDDKIELINNQALGAYFTWDPVVIVDNVSAPIIISEMNDNHEDNELMAIISFPRGDTIVWDPKVGVKMDSTKLVEIIEPLLNNESSILQKALPFSPVVIILMALLITQQVFRKKVRK